MKNKISLNESELHFPQPDQTTPQPEQSWSSLDDFKPATDEEALATYRWMEKLLMESEPKLLITNTHGCVEIHYGDQGRLQVMREMNLARIVSDYLKIDVLTH